MTPETPATQLVHDAEAAVRRRAFKDAHALCLEALRVDATCADAFFLLGVIASEHGNWAKGAELFGAALARDDAPARYHAHLAKALIGLRKRNGAHAAALAAGERAPDDALTLDTIGVVLSHVGDHAAAADFFKCAAARDPGNANYAHNLGVSLQFAGDFDAAADAYRNALAIDPKRRGALTGLVQLSKQTRESNHLAALETLFAGASEANERLELGHAIAKSYDDLGEYAEAADWLAEAKAAKRASLRYSIEEDERALFEAAAQAAREARGKTGFETREPIFVVGLPRTGTTLVDRILSSHPDVMSAGELDHFSSAIQALSGKDPDRMLSAETLAQAGRLDMRALGEAYLTATRPRTGATPRFIDKMPRNVLFAGLMLAAMPNARVICLRRGAMDSCLSNYRQVFNAESPYYRYTYDLEDVARYYVLFDALVAEWRASLPADRFIEVRYESVVADLEGEARRMVAFCGLDWDARCLAFHENAAPVATASSVQVRSPIYATSVGRWKRYGDALTPMRRVLEAAGVVLE